MKSYDSRDIIAQYITLPNESPIPRKGNFELFYESFIDRDNSVLLTDGKDFHVFYFTSYDIVEEVRDDPPIVIFEPYENAVKCIIVFNPKGEQVTSIIALDMREKDHRDFLKRIHATHTINFHFISMLFGELTKMKSLSIEVPQPALTSIVDL